MNRKTPFSVGEYYHIYNRGVEKREIFLDEHDYKRFLRLIFFCNSEKKIESRELLGFKISEGLEHRGQTIVDIGAFCLMPNHFHLLLKEKVDNGISIFMKKVLTAYSMYFNIKNKRSGSLFEGTFKSSHADNDEYLKYLFAYIHLNPAKIADSHWRESKNNEDAYEFAKNYKYSSFSSYLDNSKEESLILNYLTFPEYFTNSTEWKNSILDWLNSPKD
ncbi:MAG: transposase [Minisyncoccia bacterium]